MRHQPWVALTSVDYSTWSSCSLSGPAAAGSCAPGRSSCCRRCRSRTSASSSGSTAQRQAPPRRTPCTTSWRVVRAVSRGTFQCLMIMMPWSDTVSDTLDGRCPSRCACLVLPDSAPRMVSNLCSMDRRCVPGADAARSGLGAAAALHAQHAKRLQPHAGRPGPCHRGCACLDNSVILLWALNFGCIAWTSGQCLQIAQCACCGHLD